MGNSILKPEIEYLFHYKIGNKKNFYSMIINTPNGILYEIEISHSTFNDLSKWCKVFRYERGHPVH